MNRTAIGFLGGTIILFILLGMSLIPKGIPIKISYPAYWPKPVYDFDKNPLTEEGVALGRKLFYDPILSKDNTISCSSCHLSYTAFTHVDHALSHGIGDSIGKRNSAALMNLAWNRSFMWDGAVHHLDVQALAPISDPREMGNSLKNVIDSLRVSSIYPVLFYQAFGDSLVTGEHLLKALAQFQLTLISANSKYDKVMRKEEGVGFTDQEKAGYQIFKQHCNRCHTEPLFTNGEFMNNGLPVDSLLLDKGRMAISLTREDSLKFKVPSLRNIEYSHPYMHDGRFKKLSHAIRHYTNGIHDSPTLDPMLREGIVLTSEQRIDLLAFLLTLSDRSFLFNPEHAFPRK